jgi:hypothetical protein
MRAGGFPMAIWFTVRLTDRPGSLGALATALGDRSVNITGIVGVAEDTDGTLMLTTSDPAATRSVLAELGIAFEAHDSDVGITGLGPGHVRRGLADRGFSIDEADQG